MHFLSSLSLVPCGVINFHFAFLLNQTQHHCGQKYVHTYQTGKWLLLGITSNGDGCGRANRPGVYTRVSSPAILGWIHNTTGKCHSLTAEFDAKHTFNDFSPTLFIATYWSTQATSQTERPLDCEGHRCPLGKCLRRSQVCDQVLDCPEDASDELSCDYHQTTTTSGGGGGGNATTKVHTASSPSVEH